jgi:uncharacterized protein YqeY
MSTLITTIKVDQLAARKAREQGKTALLTTLIGEADTKAKNEGTTLLSDEKTLKLVTTFISNLRDNLKLIEPNSIAGIQATQEIEILEKYVPTQLTEDELVAKVKAILVDSPEVPKIGVLMGALKQQLTPGTYDGKLLADVVKRLIS